MRHEIIFASTRECMLVNGQAECMLVNGQAECMLVNGQAECMLVNGQAECMLVKGTEAGQAQLPTQDNHEIPIGFGLN